MLTNCSIAGQGFYDLKAVLLAHQRPKQNERVPGGDISVRKGRGRGGTCLGDHTGGPYGPGGAENAVGDDARRR